MNNDIKVKMIHGTETKKQQQLETFKKDHRVINTFNTTGGMMIIKYSLGQAQFDDMQEIKSKYPWDK